jgi:hypothetical protein
LRAGAVGGEEQCDPCDFLAVGGDGFANAYAFHGEPDVGRNPDTSAVFSGHGIQRLLGGNTDDGG